MCKFGVYFAKQKFSKMGKLRHASIGRSKSFALSTSANLHTHFNVKTITARLLI